MKKINVIGTSGSGKSSFARKLSEKLNHPYIEMDALFWGKDWDWPPDEVFFDKLKQAINRKSWVLDGNYTRTTDLKWKDVDTVIWIDYSFIRTLYQAVARAIQRATTQKELWPGTGNRESFKKLISKDSIIFWTVKTYRQNRMKYLQMSQSDDYNHIQFIQLKNPMECQNFLIRIGR